MYKDNYMGIEYKLKYFTAVFDDDKILLKTDMQTFLVKATKNKKYLDYIKEHISSGSIKCYNDLFNFMYNEDKTVKLLEMVAVEEKWYE